MTLLNHQVEVHVLCMGTCGEVSINTSKSTKGITSKDGSHLIEGYISGDQTTTYEEGHLHDVCPCHGSQTSVNRINTSHDKKTEDDEHTDTDFKAKDADSQALQTKNLLNGQSTKPSYGCEVYEHI